MSDGRCCERVYLPGRLYYVNPNGTQCSRKAKVSVDGKLYCTQHSPERSAERSAARSAAFHANIAVEKARRAVVDAALAAPAVSLPGALARAVATFRAATSEAERIRKDSPR